jgi:hypothetical protein
VEASLLLTDLYQLSMLHSYFRRGMEETAVFEFSVRSLPATRGFLVAAGLEQVVPGDAPRHARGPRMGCGIGPLRRGVR